MAEVSDSLLELPTKVLDWILETLGKVGLEPPALVTQLFLLAIVLVLVAVSARSAWQKGNDWNLMQLAGCVALTLVGLGVLWGIVVQSFLPSEVAGRVEVKEVRPDRVDLLDYRGNVVASTDMIDTTDGRFVLIYSPALHGRARKVRASAASCTEVAVTVSQAQLAAESRILLYFPCERK